MIGLGTWRMGQDPSLKDKEIETLVYAYTHHHVTLIDTAEMYHDSEYVVGEAVKRIGRENLTIINKILPHHVRKGEVEYYCRESLKKCQCDYFDVYLLHWRGMTDLQLFIDEMELLVEKGLIKHWGVSNFDTDDMEELLSYENGHHCVMNQVCYNLMYRGIEYDLIPYCKSHDITIVAYASLGNDRYSRETMIHTPVIQQLAHKNQMSLEAVLLSALLQDNVIPIFKTSSKSHLDNNLKGLSPLSKEDKERIDQYFPKPTKKELLMKI